MVYIFLIISSRDIVVCPDNMLRRKYVLTILSWHVKDSISSCELCEFVPWICYMHSCLSRQCVLTDDASKRQHAFTVCLWLYDNIVSCVSSLHEFVTWVVWVRYMNSPLQYVFDYIWQCCLEMYSQHTLSKHYVVLTHCLSRHIFLTVTNSCNKLRSRIHRTHMNLSSFSHGKTILSWHAVLIVRNSSNEFM